MKIEKLKQNIIDGDGKWVAKENFIFTQNGEDGTIHVRCNRENEIGTGFLMRHSNGKLEEFYINNGINLKDINKTIRFVKMLNDILETNITIESVTEKEVKIEVEKIVTDEKSVGMIEAYERLLLGRKVTLEN